MLQISKTGAIAKDSRRASQAIDLQGIRVIDMNFQSRIVVLGRSLRYGIPSG
jgi:hypothetical protein